MSKTIAAIGEQPLLEGFRLAGAKLYACRGDAEILSAWKSLQGTRHSLSSRPVPPASWRRSRPTRDRP